MTTSSLALICDSPHATLSSSTTALTPTSRFDASDLLKTINTVIRDGFERNKHHNSRHIAKSRQLMLANAQHLKGEGTIVILGAGPLEPLRELIRRCSELILIDYDLTMPLEVTRQLDFYEQQKVTILNADLTGGLCKQIDALFVRAYTNGLGVCQVHEEIIDLLNDFTPQKLFARIDADYVISSLVASQLPAFCVEYTDEKLDELASLWQGSTFQIPTEQKEKYRKAFDRLAKALFKNHIEDIAALVKPSGKAYFGDTFNAIEYVGLTDRQQLVKPKSGFYLAELETALTTSAHFKVTKLKKWTWFSAPQRNKAFNVQAYVLQKNPRDEPHNEFESTTCACIIA